jgi:Fanconi anemia group M protein
MVSEYLEHDLVKPNSIEMRDYQTSLASQAKIQNSLVVLPTGLGKTTIALQVILDILSQKKGGVLFLAPTRVLVNQHFEFLKEHVLLDDIGIVTGEDLIPKRKKSWVNSIVCATPEITRNDLQRGIVPHEQFSLVVFDEAHRAVGDYAYTSIAANFSSNVLFLAMTATLPSDKQKADEIVKSLRINSVLQKTDESPDVKPYIQETKTEWINVELPLDMKAVQTCLKLALDERYTQLRKNGIQLSTENKSLSALLRARQYVLTQNRRSAKPLFTAIRITYSLNILEAHGITSFLKFCERAQKKKGVGVKELFEVDPNFTRAIQLSKIAQKKGIEHPKIPKLLGIVSSVKDKVLIFTSYRDSVNVINERLNSIGVKSEILIGKSGETGLKQKKQIETVQRFRDGQIKVLVATRVGEEGLDISEVNLVIFYDNVPSSIRFVQRRGRTGRKASGRLVVLIAKDTIDEVYYWIGRRKMESAKTMGEKLSKKLETQEITSESLDNFL